MRAFVVFALFGLMAFAGPVLTERGEQEDIDRWYNGKSNPGSYEGRRKREADQQRNMPWTFEVLMDRDLMIRNAPVVRDVNQDGRADLRSRLGRGVPGEIREDLNQGQDLRNRASKGM